MTDKNFDEWNLQKKRIQNKVNNITRYYEREVWWCAFGVNIGSEQDGSGDFYERPGLVLRKLSTTTAIVLPLSTKQKRPNLHIQVHCNNIDNFVLLDQVRVIDILRFKRKIGQISQVEFYAVKNAFGELLR